jgi:hypothetical protein
LGANTTSQADGKTNVTFNKFVQWSPIQNFITINPTAGLAVKILGTVFGQHRPIMQINQQSNPQKTQHYNLCWFRFIPFCYMFCSIILTIIMQRQNASTKGKLLLKYVVG